MAYLLILILPFLNRAAGNGFYGLSSYLRGRALYYVSILLFFILWPLYGLANAVILSSCFLIWRTPAWGRWFDIGTMPVLERKANKFERMLEIIISPLASKGGVVFDFLCLLLRNIVCLTPLALVTGFSLATFFLAFFITLSYALFASLRPTNPIPSAELLAGLVWASYMIVLF